METLVGAGIVASKTEYRRLKEAGAIRYADSGEECTDAEVRGRVIRVGKHRFVKIT
jgi:tyrosyl-tRNA synthetase